MGDQQPIQAVPDPILCSPYKEPGEHWVYPTGDQAGRQPYRYQGRRPASYWFKEQRTGESQQGLFREENRDDLPLVNRLREDVRRWREAGWRGASEVTKDLLRHWTNPDRRPRLFFCQREAVETVIYLLELRLAGLSSRTGFKNFDCSDADLQLMLRGERPAGFQLADQDYYPTLVDQPADASLLGLRRLGCKMATGSGKTLVMAMLITWAFCNRGRNPQSEGFPNAVLVVAPNLTVRSRLSVLRPEEPNNYYDQFKLVPTGYRDFLQRGKVLVTNWHVFGKKNPHSDGGATYRVVDKGEEDARAFALARLGEMASRLPLLVLNDEGHHCWRPKVEGEIELEADSKEAKAALEHEVEEARVWLDGLDRINNSGLLGPKKPCVLATVDLSATPFFLGGSGHMEGSPFPWLVSDFGLVDAIESGIVKVPRLPVLQVGGNEKADEAGRPDPKYFRLWEHLKKEATAADKKGKGIKPEAIYRLAEGALKTLAGQWLQRFEQYRAASATQQTIPPAMIVVCHETEAAEVFYRMISGERVEEVPTEGGKTETRTVYGDSYVLKELANEPGVLRTLRIDSKLLAKLESDEDASKDEKVAEVRRIIDTIGRTGQPGEHVRCIVSVSMLTEGWDANNVTQILGVRAFGSQLLCEQVVGRGLRRRSYDVNEKTGLLEAEYVDVYGIPFTLIPFKGRETDSEAPEDKPKNHVRPVSGREHLEIRAPNVQSFVYDLRLDGVECDVSKLEPLVVKDEPTAVYIDAVRGYRDQIEDAQHTRKPEQDGYIRHDRAIYYSQVHEQAIHFQLAQRILERLIAGAESGKDARFRLQAKHMLFPQLVRFVKQYIDTRVQFAPGVDRKEVGMQKYAERVVDLIANGIVPTQASEDAPLLPVLHRVHRYHTTADAEETTTRPVVPVEKSHVNGVIFRSQDERQAAELLDRSPYVESFVANGRAFGLDIPYDDGQSAHVYQPDYLVRLRGGMQIVLEIKGLGGERWDPNSVQLKSEAAKKWVAAVNNAQKFGKWDFAICRSIEELDAVLDQHAKNAGVELPFRKVSPKESDKFKTCVPLVQLKSLAFQVLNPSPGQGELFDRAEWVELQGDHELKEGMFVAQILGKSMEDTFPDGSWCLFRRVNAGSRQGRVLMVVSSQVSDPAYSAGYTVRKYRSEQAADAGSAQFTRVYLEPLNAHYPTMELKVEDERSIHVVAECVATLGR